MTERQAKSQSLRILHGIRDNALELIYDYLWMTLSDGAANYLSATGILSTTKSTSSLRCELRNVLASKDFDPNLLIVKKTNKRRAKISYKGLVLSDYIRRKGYILRHR